MIKKRFKFERFDVDIENINEISLYEIDNNPSDDLDDSNLFYVYSTTDANVQAIVDKLNSQEERIKELEEENAELRQDNDIKFWKLKCIYYFNANSLFMSEISRAIKKGYEVSEQFQKFLDDVKEHNKEVKEKNKRLFGDSDD